MHDRSRSITKIDVVETLRGVASLSVAVFHFAGQLITPLPQFLASIGWVGLDMFFVISGFVIPYSLLNKGYKVTHFPRFIARRLVRLEPPYLMSILLVLLLWHASTLFPAFAGAAPSYSAGQIASHFLYVIPLTRYEWLNPVYWSLAYEFVFYVLVGLLFPSLIRRNPSWTLLVVAAIAGAAYCVTAKIDLHILEFGIGILTMRAIASELDSKGAMIGISLAVCVMLLFGDPIRSVAVATTSLLILVFHSRSLGAWATVIGSVSYSLYLTHTTIGGRVINLGKRFGDGPIYELGLVAVALAISIAFAVAFSTLIERPAIRASRLVRF